MNVGVRCSRCHWWDLLQVAQWHVPKGTSAPWEFVLCAVKHVAMAPGQLQSFLIDDPPCAAQEFQQLWLDGSNFHQHGQPTLPHNLLLVSSRVAHIVFIPPSLCRHRPKIERQEQLESQTPNPLAQLSCAQASADSTRITAGVITKANAATHPLFVMCCL